MKQALAIALLLTVAACGYTAGMGLQREGIRTVGIQVATNETFRQRMEIPLTTQLYAQLPIHTGLIVASPDSADAVLSIDIQSVAGRSLAQGGADPVREGALLFSVHAVLRDRVTGTILRDEMVLDRAEFRSPVGETEDSALREAASDLARKIALALEPDF